MALLITTVGIRSIAATNERRVIEAALERHRR
jgi:hypothetical protein